MKPESSLNPEVLIPISELTRDPKLRVRLQSDPNVVAEYRRLQSAGKKLPPVDVVQDGERKWLIDGFMNVEACELNGQTTVPARVVKGSYEDAVKMALKANQQHGLRLTNADKRNGVKLALGQFPGSSNAVIAELCCVSAQTVANVRSQIWGPEEVETPRKGKDGKTYAPKTSTKVRSQPKATNAESAIQVDVPVSATPEEGDMIEVPIISIDLGDRVQAPLREPMSAEELRRRYAGERDRLLAAINADLAELAELIRSGVSAERSVQPLEVRCNALAAFASDFCSADRADAA